MKGYVLRYYCVLLVLCVSLSIENTNVINVSYSTYNDCLTASSDLSYSPDCDIDFSCDGNSLYVVNSDICSMSNLGNVLNLSVEYLYRFNTTFTNNEICTNARATIEGSSYCDIDDTCTDNWLYAYSNSNSRCYLSLVQVDGISGITITAP